MSCSEFADTALFGLLATGMAAFALGLRDAWKERERDREDERLDEKDPPP